MSNPFDQDFVAPDPTIFDELIYLMGRYPFEASFIISFLIIFALIFLIFESGPNG